MAVWLQRLVTIWASVSQFVKCWVGMRGAMWFILIYHSMKCSMVAWIWATLLHVSGKWVSGFPRTACRGHLMLDQHVLFLSTAPDHCPLSAASSAWSHLLGFQFGDAPGEEMTSQPAPCQPQPCCPLLIPMIEQPSLSSFSGKANDVIKYS